MHKLYNHLKCAVTYIVLHSIYNKATTFCNLFDRPVVTLILPNDTKPTQIDAQTKFNIQ